MNPYPFAPLNHFTVPFSLTKNSFRLFSKLFLPLVCDGSVPSCPKAGRPPPKEVRKCGSVAASRGYRPKRNGSLSSARPRPETKHNGAAKTKERCRLPSQKRQPVANSATARAAEHQIITGRFRLARAKLFVQRVDLGECDPGMLYGWLNGMPRSPVVGRQPAIWPFATACRELRTEN